MIIISTVVSGCGDRRPEASSAPSLQQAGPAHPEPDSAAVTDQQSALSPVPLSKAETDETDPALRALVGTAWQIKEHRIWFLDGERARVRSPQLEPYAPGGLVTRYRFENGAISMNVMGRAIRLEWDGNQLRAEGFAAERLP